VYPSGDPENAQTRTNHVVTEVVIASAARTAISSFGRSLRDIALPSPRTNPYKREDGPQKVRETLSRHDLDGLIAIGGEDTLGVANRLYGEGVHVVGVPKTIDNDLGATDVTFGFDTALGVATEAIDRLHTTAESHNRILVVEVMGRHAGWIALHSGIAGGADVILIPEIPFDIDETCRHIRRRHERGRYFPIVVAAEGAIPKEGTKS
jgi:6-phosphofructokinase